jgi:hypothetical protein
MTGRGAPQPGKQGRCAAGEDDRRAGGEDDRRAGQKSTATPSRIRPPRDQRSRSQPKEFRCEIAADPLYRIDPAA